jgi:hypothetical protein
MLGGRADARESLGEYMNKDIISSWETNKEYLEKAKAIIKDCTDPKILKILNSYNEYIENNEFELAANILDCIELYTYEDNKAYLIPIIDAYLNMELYDDVKRLIDRLEREKKR